MRRAEERDRRNSLRALFIDVDNTLYDFEASVTATFTHLRERFPEVIGHVTPEDLERLYWDASNAATKEYKLALIRQDPMLYRRFLWEGVLDRLAAEARPARGERAATAEALAETFARYRFATMREHAYPGALEALRAASRRYTVGIITNGPPELQRAKLDALGIHDWFEPHLVFVSGEFGEDKPSPNLFNAAAKAASVDAAACAMVGDNLECDIGCRAVGWYGVLFSGKPAPPEVDPGCPHPPDHVARSWVEVREHLRF